MSRILVIDDSRTQAADLSGRFEDAGFDVVTAHSGEAGLAALAAFPDVAIVVSDVVMPGMDGYECCRRMKALRAVPVLLVTALTDPAEIVRALGCGADGFVTKDHGGDRIIERARQVLARRAIGEERSAGGVIRTVFQGQQVEITADRSQVLDLLLGTFEDIVEANRALEASRVELARKNEALLRAQRQREELAALLVHDLKSPAAGITTIAGLRLRSPQLGPDERRHWSSVQAAAASIGRMALNLLDISRSEDGALIPKPTDVGLHDLIAEIPDTCTEDQRRRLVLDVRSPATACVDREMIRRVVHNLVDNAFRHAQGPTAVHVTLSRRREGVEIRVADEGPGIPVADRPRVFEKYVRLDGAPSGSGRGLGLAFCRLAVEAHHGRVHIEDNQPTGAVFVVTLPER